MSSVSSEKNTLIVDNFNVHTDNNDNKLSTKLLSILDSLVFIQHVTRPQNGSGHKLDLVITPRELKLIDVSNHVIVLFKLKIAKPSIHER